MQMIENPLHLAVLGGIGSPMLVDGCDKRLLGRRDHIPYGVAGGGRANIIVLSPGHVDWYLEIACEIYHIIVCHSVEFVRSIHSVDTEEMRIPSGTSGLVSGHIAKSRMVDHTSRDTWIESSADDSKGTPLASALHYDILTVPLGQSGEEINGTDKSEVDTLHIIIVAVVKAVAQIAIFTTIESAGYFIEFLSGNLRVQAVNLHLEADAAVLSIIAVAQRLLYGLYSGTGRTYHDGAAAGLGIARHEEIAVD